LQEAQQITILRKAQLRQARKSLRLM